MIRTFINFAFIRIICHRLVCADPLLFSYLNVAHKFVFIKLTQINIHTYVHDGSKYYNYSTDEGRVETAILAESIKCLSLIIEIMFIALITVFLTFISTMIQ